MIMKGTDTEMKKVMDRDSITDKKHYLIQDEED